MFNLIKEIIEESNFTILQWENKPGWPVTFVSNNISKYGYSTKDFLKNKLKFSELIISKDKKRIEKEVEYYLSNNIDNFKQTYGIYTKEGLVKYIEDQTIVKRSESGEIVYLIGVINDQTELVNSKLKLNKQKHFLNKILNELNISVIIYDKNINIIFDNLFSKKMNLSKENRDLITKKIQSVTCSFVENEFCNIQKEYLSKFPKKFNIENNNKKYEVIINKFEENGVLKIIESIKEITELENIKIKVKELESHDTLTSLPNKKIYEKDILKLIKENKRFSIIALDINDFKKINDNFGMSFGDRLLVIIKNKFLNLEKTFKKSLKVYRFSGDEFHFIINDSLKEEEIIDSLIKIFKNAFTYKGESIYLSASLGSSIFPDNGTDFQTLSQYSEIAMFFSKKSKIEGKTIHNYFKQNMLEDNKDSLTFINKLRIGLKNHEFQLYYQPQICTQRNKLIGVEALVRWIDQEGKVIPPYKFISLSEKTGLIIPLGYEIINIAFNQMKNWEKKSIDVGTLAINLSIKQLKEDNFLDNFKLLLKKYNIKANKITLEITESYLMDDPERAIAILNEIKSLGVHLAIDDFGTGYSSLSYLKKLPIDKLKIDKSFIDNIISDPNDQIIVKTIINLGRNFGMSLIAEGVETEDQKELLKKIDCLEIQGYLYSKPITAKELELKYF